MSGFYVYFRPERKEYGFVCLYENIFCIDITAARYVREIEISEFVRIGKGFSVVFENSPRA